MSQQPTYCNTQNSPYTSLLSILVVIVVLSIVIFNLTSSPDKPVNDNKSTLENIAADVLPEITISDTTANELSKSAEQTIVVAASTTPTEVSDNNEQDKKEIHQFIKDWQSAWQNSAGPNGNLETYFTFYSDSYTAGQLNKTQWQNSKKIRNQVKSWIEVWISDIRMAKKSDGNYRVTFNQEYSSSNYSDKGNKELIIVKNGSDWQIINERSF